MDKMHIAITAVGIILFLWFAIPIAAGIFNIGNVTGMILSAAVAAYGMFYQRVHVQLAQMWQNGGGKVLLAAVCSMAAAVCAAAVVETILIVQSAFHQPPTGTNATAVVLGCSVKGTRPSTVLAERIEAAYEYLTEHPDAVCVLSGGKGEGEDISEAECMYRCLTAKGIDGNRLIKEDRSTTTEENLRFSRELLKERGIEEPITIITSEFHQYRANQVAKRLGIISYSTPSHTFILYLPTFYVRELYGILYYRIR